MQRLTPGKLALSACLAAVVLTAAAHGQDKEKKPVSRPGPMDKAIYTNLREVINHGATLYNQGDWNGCYHLWEGSLMSIRPLLSTHGKLQETIDSAITTARQDPMLWHRAWVLRTALDEVRKELKGAPLGKEDEKMLETKEPEQPKKKTLWARLGGEAGVTRIVDDFVNLAAPDQRINFFRSGKFPMTDEQVVKMKREIIEQISQASGGPLKYKGPDMKQVHKNMGITNEEFDAAAADLKKALEKNKVAPDDVKTVLNAVERYRKDVVQPKPKTDDKKTDDKKTGDKKTDDKKTGDKKTEDKKTGDKKTDDKKPEATASVEGKVTYKGKPASGAMLSFIGNDRNTYSVFLDANGSYKKEGVKPGEYKVTLTEVKKAGPPGGKPGAAAVAIPAKYGTSATTPLKATIKESKQNVDFELKD